MIKVGLVGCGRISQSHFGAIAKLPGAKVVGCCDIVARRAKTAAEENAIPFWTTRYEELLEDKDIDLVSICTPSGLHAEHGILAAKSGKHVLTEKPMTVKFADAHRLITACAEAEVQLFVVFQNRFNPAIQLVKNALDDGRFGRINMIVANVFWSRPQEYYDMAPWRGTLELDGGAFCNQASHYVDLVQWFGGPVKSITAQTATLGRDIEAEDTGVAVLKFHSGSIASINVTMLTYPKNLEGSITILGERGTARVGGVAVNELLHWDVADFEAPSYPEFSTITSSVYGSGHQALYRRLIEALGQEKHALPNGLDGQRSVAILDAIRTSNSTQSTVFLEHKG